MKYLYAPKSPYYADLASGRVLYNRPGATAFPVRLASEIFGRACAYLREQGSSEPSTLYDPCCGGAYLLASLGFLHSPKLATLIGSDVDEEMLQLAGRNLGLLSSQGIEYRIRELQELLESYGKEAHREALASALRLKGMLAGGSAVTTLLFRADVLREVDVIRRHCPPVDLVITDVPYGATSQWRGRGRGNPTTALLENIAPVLKQRSVVALICAKGSTVQSDLFERMKRVVVGHRQVFFLVPAGR